MKRKILIAPSILSADFSRLGEEIRAVERAGADWLHIDVMDGVFVPNITIGPVVVKAVRRLTAIPFDVHLMIRDPGAYVESFARAGADIITFHVEAVEDPAGVIERIHAFGKKAGISLRPGTAVSALIPFLPLADMALVMTVEPGFGGQRFMSDCVGKIAEVKAVFEKDIQVDGGINEETAPGVIAAGANAIVAGTAVFGSADYARAIAGLRGTTAERS